MDKQAILQDILKRNELRREAQLPLLDVEEEVRHECEWAAWRAYYDFCDLHADVRQRFRDEVAQEIIAAEGRDYRLTGFGRWAIGHRADLRFHAFIKETFGIIKPAAPSKNMVGYGQGAAQGKD